LINLKPIAQEIINNKEYFQPRMKRIEAKIVDTAFPPLNLSQKVKTWPRTEANIIKAKCHSLLIK